MELYCSEECFLQDVAKHEMKILHYDGAYRHIRFSKPGTRCMSFDLVTWPGYLCFCGDMGDFVFSRSEDMFEFFRSSGHKSHPGQVLAVNFEYWAEKCLAVDKHCVIKEYSPEKFCEVINEILDDDDDATDELRKAIAEEVFCVADDGPEAAHEAARNFLWDGKKYFTDFWEYRLSPGTMPEYLRLGKRILQAERV